MELRHLRYFVAVAEEEHFGRAARRLHVSQPPLSRQVKQLEAELGVPLFEHVGRRVRLTPAGRAFLDGARATLDAAQRATRTAQQAARGEVGHLDVAFVDNTTWSGLLPEIVTRLRGRRPELVVDLSSMTTAAQWEALRDRRIDAGYCYYRPDEPDVKAECIYHDRVVVALPRGHRLARQPRLRARDLDGEPIIWFPRRLSPRYYDQIVGALATRGATLNVVQESSTDATRLSLVGSGLGATLVVESVTAMRPRRVVFRALEDLRLDVQALVIWRAGEEKSPQLSALLEVTREVRDVMAERAKKEESE